MSLAPNEQFKAFLEKSEEVLILIPENPTGDAVGSAWALYFFLEKKSIRPTIAFSNNLSPKYSYLPKPKRILNEISGARTFVLSFDTTRNKIIDLKTEKKENKYNIYLTPERGSINPKDFSFILAKFQYDLIVVLDCPDLEKLGKLYEANPDLFFEVPIVNIDWRSKNDNFGQINLVDITASSCSEILYNALAQIDYASLDKTIADCFLTGIISATDSFQKKNTTPKSLTAAATLMDRGADQQSIIRWLYKTQPLNILKLWGRAMSRLNWDEKSRLVWTGLSVEDFVQSRSEPKDVPSILEKLQENYSEGKIFMALYNDTPDSSVAIIKCLAPEDTQKIHGFLNGSLIRDILEIKLATGNLDEAGELLSKRIKELGI
ncbi:MAG TPA: DHH family phosphoesterase [Patescibacteria group bacterium]